MSDNNLNVFPKNLYEALALLYVERFDGNPTPEQLFDSYQNAYRKIQEHAGNQKDSWLWHCSVKLHHCMCIFRYMPGDCRILCKQLHLSAEDFSFCCISYIHTSTAFSDPHLYYLLPCPAPGGVFCFFHFSLLVIYLLYRLLQSPSI